MKKKKKIIIIKPGPEEWRGAFDLRVFKRAHITDYNITAASLKRINPECPAPPSPPTHVSLFRFFIIIIFL